MNNDDISMDIYDPELLDGGFYDEPAGEPEPHLPPYLAEPEDTGFYYGTLSYNKRRKLFIIEGDTTMCRAAKAFITGCGGRGKNTATVKPGRRATGELNWFMLRYPLKIEDREIWREHIDNVRRQALMLERIRLGNISEEPAPGHFEGELMDFQKYGLGFLMNRERALLADEMGLGKTIEALAWLCTRGSYPALIICPTHLITNWNAEIKRFLRMDDGQPPRVHIIRGLRPYPLPEADIYLCHYLLLRGWKKELPRAGFRSVIFDEVQELRHSRTEKYSAASLVSESADYVFGLSGTPIYNRGGEIWNVINAIDFHALGDWESFSRQWCYGYGGDIVTDPKALGEHLRTEGLMLRRTKADVLQELPPKRRIVQQIDSDADEYDSMMALAVENVRRIELSDNPGEIRMLKEELAMRERQATGVAKAPYVCAFAEGLLEAGEKVLLFAHHHMVMDIYKERLAAFSPVFITGRENEKQKESAVQSFKTGQTNLCCISLRAASGLNLQEASCVVFGELDWSPAVHSQAEDRAHRMGQKDSILCYYLVTSTGSDGDMQECLGLKVSQFAGLMGQEDPDPDDMLSMQISAREHIEAIAERIIGKTKKTDKSI